MPTVKARSSQSRPSMMGSSRAEKEPGPLRISWLWPCSAAETGWEWVWALGPEWVCAIVRDGGGSGMAHGLKEAVRWSCAGVGVALSRLLYRVVVVMVGVFESGGGVSYLASSWMLDQVQISINDIT